MRDVIGTISFPTRSALAVWRAEILGQLSDGMWENTAPHDHWEFWHQLRTVVDGSKKPHVVMDEGRHVPYNQKVSYNVAGLYPIIGDRMLAFGRMGRTLSSVVDVDAPKDPGYDERHGGTKFDACVHAAEYLAEMGLEAFLAERASGKYSKPWTESYLKQVDEETARRFFSTKYTMKDLRADVKDIKAAFKTARQS